MPKENQEKETVYMIAHCLLNPLARVKGIRRPEQFDTMNKKVIQLPCPEFIYAGPDRGKKSKEEYDMLDYRVFCLELFLPYADMIENLFKDGHEIRIQGIPKSPSCGVLTTSVRNTGGSETVMVAAEAAPKMLSRTTAEISSEIPSENRVIEAKGIFFEEIEKELMRRHVSFEMSE